MSRRIREDIIELEYTVQVVVAIILLVFTVSFMILLCLGFCLYLFNLF